MDHSRASNLFLKMERTLWISATGILLLCLSSADGYSKYGRSCKDIGCLSNEVCEIAQDPCSLYERTNCGNYPTCVRKDNSATVPSCVTMRCPSGKYCKTVDGQPTCLNTLPGLDFDSAGVSSVNGQPASSDSNNRNYNSGGSNFNPYANANAPPPERHDTGTNYHSVNSGSGLGYPAYPSNTGASGNGASNFGGYPPYPSNTGNGRQQPNSETNLGYPPYPTQNRMPQPGWNQQPNYPVNNGGYPPNPNNPNYPNYPYQNYNTNARRPYKSSAFTNSPGLSHGLTCLAFLLITKYLS